MDYTLHGYTCTKYYEKEKSALHDCRALIYELESVGFNQAKNYPACLDSTGRLFYLTVPLYS